MSKTYQRICLDHSPILTVDWDHNPDLAHITTGPVPPDDDHPTCSLGVLRFSGGLTGIWLPDGKKSGSKGRWYDVTWGYHNQAQFLEILLKWHPHDQM